MHEYSGVDIRQFCGKTETKICTTHSNNCISLELCRRAVLTVLIYLPCWPFSIQSFFLTQNNRGPGPPLDPPLILNGNAAFYLSSSPANTIGIPVLWTDRHYCWHSWAMNIPSYRLVSLHVSIYDTRNHCCSFVK